MRDEGLYFTFEEFINQPRYRVAVDLILSRVRHVDMVEREAVGIVHNNLRLAITPD